MLKILLASLAATAITATAQTTHVTLTTYNATVAQCNSEPLITADGTKIQPRHVDSGRQRIVAVSRDLLREFPYGSTIHVDGYGLYEVHDTMHARFRQRVDILIPKHAKHDKKDKVKIKRVK